MILISRELSFILKKDEIWFSNLTNDCNFHCLTKKIFHFFHFLWKNMYFCILKFEK
jgi:hypothetical protein